MKKTSRETRLPDNRDLHGTDGTGKQMLSRFQKSNLMHDLRDHSEGFTVVEKIATLVRSSRSTATELLQEVVASLATAWQYPEITAARIRFQGLECVTQNFRETPWKQSASFALADGRRCDLEVFSSADGPAGSKNPFLSKDGIILGSIAELLRSHLEWVQAVEGLQREKDFSESIINSLPGVFYLIDEQRKIIRWNKNLEIASGYSADEIARMDPLDFLAGDEKIIIEQKVREVFNEGTFTAEASLVSKHGKKRPYDFAGLSVVLGQNQYLVWTGIEIAERTVGEEEALKRSKEWLATILEASRDGIIVERNEHIVYTNRAFAQLCGYESQEELVGKHISIFISEEDHERMLEFGRKRLQGEQKPSLYGFAGMRKDGSTIDMEASVSSTEVGGEKHIIAVMRDITARKEAGETLSMLLSAVEQTMDNVFVTNKDGVIEYVNPAFETLTGYTREEAIGKTPRILKSGEHGREFYETLWETIIAGKAVRSVFLNRKKDGELYYEEKTLSPVKDAQGTITHFVSTGRDITERKRAEAVLKKAEEKYRNIFENAVEGIFQSTPEGHFIDVNPTFARILGHESREEFLSAIKDIQKQLYVDPARRDEMQRLLAERGDIHGFQSQLYRKDGEIIWVSESLRAVRDSNGGILYYEGVLEDINERTLIEERNREQAELLNITPDAMIVLDSEDKVVFWSKGAEEIYGWSAEEINGQDVKRFVVESGSPNYAEVKRAVLEKGKWRGELNQLRKDGQKIIVYGRHVLVQDRTGAPESILVVSTDITEKKSLENQFYHAQRLESLGTLAGGIAHDLNNVLSTILLAVELLKRNLVNEDGQRVLETVRASTERGREIVRQVLTFSRSVEGERGDIQLKHIVREIGQIIAETFPKSIKFQLKVPKTLWMIVGDATQIHQVLLNLCVNARDAMPNGGLLQISLENMSVDEQYAHMRADAKPGLYVVLDVSDTGTGIPPDILHKMFDPFFTTKPVGKGTGLGLATVSSIVKSHNGFVRVYSIVGKGTTFKVYFPASSLTEAETAEMEKGQPDLPSGHGELILLVDDEASLLDVTKQTLEIHGYSTLTAMDGTEALAQYLQHRRSIRAIITDVIMPHLDGVGTIRALRKIDPDVKIIATSGLTMDEQIGPSFSTEIQAFLQKPYTGVKLLQTLQKVLFEAPDDRNSRPPVRHNHEESETPSGL